MKFALTIIRRASTERRCERGESNPTVDCLRMFIATTLAHTLSPHASCVAVCCCVLQCVAVCCCVAVLQCVAVCAHTLSQDTSRHEHWSLRVAWRVLRGAGCVLRVAANKEYTWPVSFFHTSTGNNALASATSLGLMRLSRLFYPKQEKKETRKSKTHISFCFLG